MYMCLFGTKCNTTNRMIFLALECTLFNRHTNKLWSTLLPHMFLNMVQHTFSRTILFTISYCFWPVSEIRPFKINMLIYIYVACLGNMYTRFVCWCVVLLYGFIIITLWRNPKKYSSFSLFYDLSCPALKYILIYIYVALVSSKCIFKFSKLCQFSVSQKKETLWEL